MYTINCIKINRNTTIIIVIINQNIFKNKSFDDQIHIMN